MNKIKLTGYFKDWLYNLDDLRARRKIMARIKRLGDGNPGDVAPVGKGVSEMRIHHGPGYRVYFVKRDLVVFVLLCGGDKKSQAEDIKTALDMAADLE